MIDTTKFYFILLVSNIIVGTFFLPLIIELMHVTTHPDFIAGCYLVVVAMVLVWPPVSAAISLMLLKLWARNSSSNLNSPPRFELPQFSTTFESINAETLLEDNFMVLVGFLHMLLMLSRILACMYQNLSLFDFGIPEYFCCRYLWKLQVILSCRYHDWPLHHLHLYMLGCIHWGSVNFSLYPCFQSMSSCLQCWPQSMGLFSITLSIRYFHSQSYHSNSLWNGQPLQRYPRLNAPLPNELGAQRENERRTAESSNDYYRYVET